MNQIFSPIQDELRDVETRLRDALVIEFEPLASILAALMKSGGKRIRPALTVLASKFHAGDADKVLTLAVAVELVHAATLIHDDLIDKSALRRGSPTINARWSATATVLAGDFLLARAADIAASIENFRLMRIFAQTLTTICIGEIRQDFGKHLPPDRDEYYQRIDSKTAMLFSACTEGGALLSGAPENEIQALKAYGHYLGMAFQIADDILDFTADETELGKPVGSDLRQGTFTLPAFNFLAAGTRGVEIAELVQSHNGQDNPELETLIEAIRHSPAIDAAKAEAQQFAQRAQAALSILPDNLFRRTLNDLAMYVVERSL